MFYLVLAANTSEPLNRYAALAPFGTQTYTTANPLNQYPSVTPIGSSTAAAFGYDLNGNLFGAMDQVASRFCTSVGEVL
ncbi:MAG: hypothetical protein KBA31_21150 [Alphaproteobacteria bacterium]|nr:hypothetical protein [Alphaproteobacteria bacterium]